MEVDMDINMETEMDMEVEVDMDNITHYTLVGNSLNQY